MDQHSDRLSLTHAREGCEPANTRPLRFERSPDPMLDPARAHRDYRTTLGPGKSKRFVLTFSEAALPFDQSFAETVAHWRQALGRVSVTVPPAKQAFADTLASTFSQILTSRDGAMLKPGTRSYDRAWIRDGAMMSDALLRMGRANVARSFADHYRGHLFARG